MTIQVTIDKKQLNRQLLRIALPIAVQGTVSATLSMVDDLMVGFLGETELAAVGVGTQLLMIHYMLIFGFISGTATFMAQFYGAGDHANIRKCIGFAQTVLAVFGILFFLAANIFTDRILSFYSKDPAVIDLAKNYLRIISPQFLCLAFAAPVEMGFKSTQQTKLPMVSSTVVFSTNTVLNYIFIFGKLGCPAMGVAGAALATSIARVLQVAVDAGFVFSKRRNLFCGSWRSYFGWKPELMKRIIKNATPTTLNEMLWALGQTMYAAAFNRIGTTDYAAYQAANSISNILSFGTFSIGDATLILVGQKLGEKKKEETWKMSNHLVRICIFAGLVTGMIMMLFAKPCAGIFNLSDLGKTYTFYIMLVIGATEPLFLYNGIMITGVLRGGGDTRFAAVSEISCVWLVAVPLAFASALIWNLPIYITFALTRFEDVVKCCILTWRYFSGRWANIVIEDL